MLSKFKWKNFSYGFAFAFLCYVIVSVIPSCAARFNGEHCRCSRPCGSRVNCLELCRRGSIPVRGRWVGAAHLPISAFNREAYGDYHQCFCGQRLGGWDYLRRLSRFLGATATCPFQSRWRRSGVTVHITRFVVESECCFFNLTRIQSCRWSDRVGIVLATVNAIDLVICEATLNEHVTSTLVWINSDTSFHGICVCHVFCREEILQSLSRTASRGLTPASRKESHVQSISLVSLFFLSRKVKTSYAWPPINFFSSSLDPATEASTSNARSRPNPERASH